MSGATAQADPHAGHDMSNMPAAAPAVALRMRDLKSGYNLQTAAEAEIELNLITITRPLAVTLEELRRACAAVNDRFLSIRAAATPV